MDSLMCVCLDLIDFCINVPPPIKSVKLSIHGT